MAHATRTILIIDDDEGMRDTLAAILKREYRVLRAPNGAAGLAILDRDSIDVVLLDVRMPGMSGFDVLRHIKDTQRLVEVIMISAITEVETAVKAMKAGAYHYITKDFEYDAVRTLVRNACERLDLNRRVLSLSAQVQDDIARPFVVGPSRQMQEVLDLVRKVAGLSATVLILGESGDRQGTAGPHGSPRVGPLRRAVPARQRRGHPVRTGGERAVRSRTRRVHGGHQATTRQVRTGVGRHAVPGRDWRAEA